MSYQDDYTASHNKYQSDLKASTTDATARAADIAHFHRLAQASHKWGIRNGSQEALKNLGVTGLPGNEAEPAS
jgi:hypothetical protein